MASTSRTVRVLGPADLSAALELMAQDPVVNVVPEYRARLTHLEPRWLGGEVWGYFEGGTLTSLCHSAVNLMPVAATDEALELFAHKALSQPRSCWTVLGPQRWVDPFWELLAPRWGPARLVRRGQRHLELRGTPLIGADPRVRRVLPHEVDLIYPASVAMYTEEVGVSPEAGGGAARYRARVAQLVSRGWAFALFEGDEVVFKAEIAAATAHAAQIQDVYTVPHRRGQGIATHAVAALAQVAMAEIAPVVSLYVNNHNEAARRAYRNVGFTQTDTFTSILF